MLLLDEPYKLVIKVGTIRIERRVWHQEVGRPKSGDSERIWGIGDLVERLRAKGIEDGITPEAFVFQQKRAPGSPCGTPEFAMPFTRLPRQRV